MGPRDSRGPVTRFTVVLLVAMIGALPLSATAAGRADCGEALLGDWFDNGRVDLLYELTCYSEAIDAIPSDIRDYSDAEEVISRALQAATRGRLARGGVDPTPAGELWNEKSRADMTHPGASPLAGVATAAVAPSGTASLPIPLLVLAGLSLALLATGALGYMSRRGGQTDEPGRDEAD